ncbi:MAG: hypothetical protein ACK55I_15970, partial [bacterium]
PGGEGVLRARQAGLQVGGERHGPGLPTAPAGGALRGLFGPIHPSQRHLHRRGGAHQPALDLPGAGDHERGAVAGGRNHRPGSALSQAKKRQAKKRQAKKRQAKKRSVHRHLIRPGWLHRWAW